MKKYNEKQDTDTVLKVFSHDVLIIKGNNSNFNVEKSLQVINVNGTRNETQQVGCAS